jgi:sodium-dependent dicarboxylate transporter 2/3/5
MKNEVNKKLIYIATALILLVFSIFNPFLNLSYEAKTTIGIFLFCITLWISEIAPLGVVGLFGIVLSVILGASNVKTAFEGFSNPVIFLMIGSFLIANAIYKYGLDKRVALYFLSKDFFLKSPFRLVLGFSLLTFFLSMWLSNTATTVIMVSIALGVIHLLKDQKKPGFKKFAMLFLLSIAYSASIGGIGTIVGSPTNLVSIGFLKEKGIEVSFLEWSIKALPVAFAIYVFMLLYIRFNIREFSISKEALLEIIQSNKAQLGKIKNEEKIVGFIFLLTVLLWILPSIFTLLGFENIGKLLNQKLPESVVAVLTASLLFIIPKDLKEFKPVMSVEDLKEIDWDTILLFASGISLGELITKSGLGKVLAETVKNAFNHEMILALLFVVIILAIILTEITSNTATAIVLTPIVISILESYNVNLINPVMSVAIAASLAFMLPISTPPNAIVYSTKYIDVKTMIKFGFLLDVIGSVIIYVFLILLNYTG